MTGRLQAVVFAVVLMGVALPLRAAEGRVGADPKEVKQLVEKAVAYLAKHQGEDGSFTKDYGPGVTAIVVAGLLQNGYSVNDPVVARALKFMQKSVKKDGGIYNKRLANYTTAVALMAFKDANRDGKYDTLIKNATKFLKSLQYERDASDVRYGGVGYDKGSRPDASNTNYFVDALVAAGISKDDPAMKRALVFVSHCQNLPGETNKLAWAKKTTPDDRGGLTYVPIVPLDKEDHHKYVTANGGLRSLGAMTYGGLKSFLYAGVSKEDARVKGALSWIRRHYTLDENPGMGKAGLYYYYHTFAKAMDALGENQFTDSKGKKHDWRRELFEVLQKRQGDDGSFINKGDRAFGEADRNLATAFALLAVSYTRK